jgi:hypothetical protein
MNREVGIPHDRAWSLRSLSSSGVRRQERNRVRRDRLGFWLFIPYPASGRRQPASSPFEPPKGREKGELDVRSGEAA